MATHQGKIDIRRSAERFRTKIGWLDGRHSFSFGEHFDPSNTRHGLLLVLNEDRVAPGQGFGLHPHRDMEIVTWMLEGEIAHTDSAGHEGVIYPGLAQRMSAGSGVMHSEMNPSKTVEAHLVQMWVPPDEKGLEPEYEQVDVREKLAKGGLVAIASGVPGRGAVRIHQKDATLWIGRLKPGESAAVPEASHVHVFVAKGSGSLEGAGELEQGDAARLTDAGAVKFAAGKAGCELIVWQTEARES